jgi:hypothetical protein
VDLLTGEPCSLEDHRAWRSDIEFTVHQEEEEFSQPPPSSSQMDRLQQEDDLQVGAQFSQPLPLSQVSASAGGGLELAQEFQVDTQFSQSYSDSDGCSAAAGATGAHPQEVKRSPSGGKALTLRR